MSRELNLSQLTTELTDFLGLPADLDLPLLSSVECKRSIDGPWRVRALLAVSGRDAARYEAISQWAAYAGGDVQVSAPYASPSQPSGMQRTLSTRVVVAEVLIELATFTDAMFAPRSAETVAR